MRKLFLLVIFVSCCTPLAFAQDRAKPEFFAGFSVDNIYTDLGESELQNASDRDMTFGFDVSATGYINKHFGIEGDVDGHFRSKTLGAENCVGDCPPPSFRIRISSYNFMAGPHVRFKPIHSKNIPFVRALVGGNHFKIGTDFPVEDVTRSSETDFALKLGGGIDLGISPHVAVRLTLDYNPVFEKNPEGGGHRRRNDGVFSVGLVFK